MNQTIHCNITIKYANLIMRDHRVHGVSIMPGVTFMDMLYRILQARGFDLNRVQFFNVVFQRPVETSADYDRRLQFSITPDGNFWRVAVASKPIRHGQLSDEAADAHLIAKMKVSTVPIPSPIDLAAIQAGATQTMTADAMYAIIRAGNIKHGPFMKVEGLLYLGSDFVLAELGLSPLAQTHGRQHLLHPALLDASTIVPAMLAREAVFEPGVLTGEIKPHIPLTIGRFRATGSLPQRVYVYLKASEKKQRNDDLIFYDYQILDGHGQLLADFTKFTEKKIRQTGLITNLISNLESKPATAQPTVTSQPKPEPASDRDFPTLLERLLGEQLDETGPIDPSQSFYDMGLDSTQLLTISNQLEALLGESLYPTLLFEQNTLEQLAHYMQENHASALQGAVAKTPTSDGTATLDQVLAQLQVFARTVLSDLGEPLDVDTEFDEQGLDPTQLLTFASGLETKLGETLYPTLLFENNTLRLLANYLRQNHGSSLHKLIKAQSEPGQDSASMLEKLRQLIGGYLQQDPGEVSSETTFYDLGLDSTQLLDISGDLENMLGESLYPTLLFEQDHIAALAQYLTANFPQAAAKTRAPKPLVKASKTPVPRETLVFAPIWKEAALANDRVAADPKAVLWLDQFQSGSSVWVRAWFEKQFPESRLIRVSVGDGFAEPQPDRFVINPKNQSDFATLIGTLAEREQLPSHFVHALAEASFDPNHLAEQLHTGFHAFFLLTQALLQHRASGDFRITFLVRSPQAHPLHEGVASFMRSVRIEHPKCRLQLLQFPVEANTNDQNWPAAIAGEWARDLDEIWIQYRANQRFVPGYQEAPLVTQAARLDADGGYLITGGAGALGYQFAQHLVAQGATKLILCGRSQLTAKQQANLESLEQRGASVHYLTADIAKPEEVRRLVAKSKEIFGSLRGVIHAAGIVRDTLFMRKSTQELDQVLAPKVSGTVNLDLATKDEPLAFFALFSSTAATFGNMGQADYAFANGFMDRFAHWRDQQHMAGNRHGKTLSINWPYWADGGMRLGAQTQQTLRDAGLVPLEHDAGMLAWETGLAGSANQWVVLQGDPQRIRQHLQVTTPTMTPPQKTAQTSPTPAPIISSNRDGQTPIAVIGVAGRYPHAPTLAAFWDVLQKGENCIDIVPADRWDAALTYNEEGDSPSGSKWGGFLEGIDQFDPLLFGISPREADYIDPQERLFLQTVWQVFENAGYANRRLQKIQNRNQLGIGVFAGVMFHHYPWLAANKVHGVMISLKSHWSIANRVSYCFDLFGPSLAINTACSASMTAIHQACESLRNGECSMAVAGGVNLNLHHGKYLGLADGLLLSQEPANRSLGRGDGYVPSEGVGAVLLKPLDQAIQDGDRIEAVIRSSMLNNGGRKNAYGVPNGIRQEALLRQTLHRVALEPCDIDYVECAANGAKLGDLMEVTALQRIFAGSGKTSLPIGTVKSNMGHMEPASGICQLTKVILQLQNRTLVPTLHTEPNHEQIQWSKLVLSPQTRTEPWPTPADSQGRPRPRRALVNSFGAGGANASLVIEEWVGPSRERSDWKQPTLIMLSARTAPQLKAKAEQLADFLGQHPETDLRDLAWTLLHGRDGLETRVVFIVEDGLSLRQTLVDFSNNQTPTVPLVTKKLKRMASKLADLSKVTTFVEAGQWQALAALWAAGGLFEMGWLPQDEDGHPIALPTYPFDQTRYWLKTQPQTLQNETGSSLENQIDDESDDEMGRNVMEALQAWVGDLLGVDQDELEPERSLFEFGFDSLIGTRLLNRIEAKWSVTMDREFYYQQESLADIAKLIDKSPQDTPSTGLAQTMAGFYEKPSADTQFPLSQGQHALWTIAQLSPDNYAYNVPLAFWVDAQVEVGALGRALAAVYRQHPALHTRIGSDIATPYQWFAPGKPPTLQLQDLGDVDDDGVLEALNHAAHAPIQLENESLMRAQLFSRDQGRAALLIMVHHIVFDGVSLPIFQRDLETAFQATKQGHKPELPEPQAHYADFVAWQQAMLAGPQAENHRKYWLKTLEGELPPLELPLDFPRKPEPSYRGATVITQLGAASSEALKALALSEKASMFAITLALVKTLLFRYTHQEDIRIGTPISGRSALRFEEVLGYFMNMVVLRDSLQPDQSFRSLVSHIRQTLFEAFAHSDYPLTCIQKDLTRERGQSPGSLFQVGFYFQNWFEENQDPEALLSQPIADIHQEGEFDLTFEILETSAGLTVFLKYNPDLFQESSILRLAGHLQTLARSVIANPECHLGSLAMMDENEIVALRHPKPAIIREDNLQKCVHQMIRSQAQSTPTRTAVVSGDSKLTYAELEQRACLLAGYLRTQGVDSGSLVGLFLHRTTDLVVGLLAILKTGAGYVPLDPVYPPDRLGYMLEDSGANLVVTQASLTHKLATPSLQILAIDTSWSTIDKSVPFSGVLGTKERLAYVIYTSGSTGKPKGVAVRHRGLTNFLGAMAEKPGIGAEDKLLAVTTMCFDIAGLEVYLPLIHGAQVHLADAELSKDGLALMDRLDEGDITIMQATPATWEMLVAAEWQPKNAIKILCGGEALSPELATALCTRSDQVWNMFGPTETTVWSTIQQIHPDAPVTIGKPIANTQVYVLDPQQQLVPMGVAGELYIGGEGVAKGYHRRPELTASKFIANPFDSQDPSLLYRTGDLVKMNATGTLIYLGRIDQQVKVNGFRIELGEIESALMRLAEIKQAIVVLRDGSTTRPRLTAFLQIQDGAPVTVEDLSMQLQAWLPDYMIPAACFSVAQYPMSLNRKVDRGALSLRPMPRLTAEIDCEPIASSTPEAIETRPIQATATTQPVLDFEGWLTSSLIHFCADLLNVSAQNIDPKSSLITFGFDSILYTELSLALRHEWAIKVIPSIFYRKKTLGAVATHLQANFGEPLGLLYQAQISSPPSHAVTQQPIQAVRTPEKPAKAIPVQEPAPKASAKQAGLESNDGLAQLCGWIADLQHIPLDQMDPEHSLLGYGFDLAGFAELRMIIEEHMPVKILPSLFYTCETTADLWAQLQQMLKSEPPAAEPPTTDDDPEFALNQLLDHLESGTLSPEEAAMQLEAEPTPDSSASELDELLAKLEDGEMSAEEALATFEAQSTPGSNHC